VHESLKNLLLVLSTQQVFQSNDIDGKEINLWTITWTKLTPILPLLKQDLFPETELNSK
jgi:hypothetical protein